MHPNISSAFETIFKFIGEGGKISIGKDGEFPCAATAVENHHVIVSFVRLLDESIEQFVVRFGNSIDHARKSGEIYDDSTTDMTFLRNRVTSIELQEAFNEHLAHFKRAYSQLFYKKIESCNLSFDDELERFFDLWETEENFEDKLFRDGTRYAWGLPSQRYRWPYQFAFAYTADAALLASDRQFDKAMDKLKEAIKFRDETITIVTTPAQTDEEFSRSRKSSGGMARAAQYKPTKDKVISLLNEMCPAEEWRTKKAAVDCILPEVELFVENNAVPLMNDNLHTVIMDWSRKDEMVQAAFDCHVKRRKSKKPQIS